MITFCRGEGWSRRERGVITIATSSSTHTSSFNLIQYLQVTSPLLTNSYIHNILILSQEEGFHTFQVDLAQPSSVSSALEGVEKALGVRASVVVYNGIFHPPFTHLFTTLPSFRPTPSPLPSLHSLPTLVPSSFQPYFTHHPCSFPRSTSHHCPLTA